MSELAQAETGIYLEESDNLIRIPEPRKDSAEIIPLKPGAGTGTSETDVLPEIEPAEKDIVSTQTDINEGLDDVDILDPGPTERDLDLIRVYLTDIGKVALLTAEQEVDLSKRYEAGLFAAEKLRIGKGLWALSPERERDLTELATDGQRARNHMLEANLRLAVSLAKRYQGKGLGLMDLIQEGNIGLIRAVEKFDYTKGYKFSTYATWWIRQALQRAIADQGRTIRVPVHMVERINILLRIQREFLVVNGREPSYEEIAAEANERKQAKGEVKDKDLLTPEKVEETLSFGKETLSLETPIGETGEGMLGDFIQDSDETSAVEVVSFGLLQRQLDHVLNNLPERSKHVVQQRFGLLDGRPRTLDEIAVELGLTRERIRQIEKETITKLKMSEDAVRLKDYL